MTPPNIPGFELLAPIRDSSRTMAWKAVQRSLDRTVVIKVLHAELSQDPAQVRCFLEVARLVARIKHPGIVQVYDVVGDVERPYVAMEWVEGPSLADRVTANGPLPPLQAVRLALQVAQALDVAWHNVRLVLRNLKPTEVRLTPQSQAKIVDFGLALQAGTEREYAEIDGGHVVGTPHFAAPEQMQGGRSLDCRTDMYALGATLYYLVTGRIPFGDLDPLAVVERQAQGQIHHPRALDARLPPGVCTLITRLMMKQPSDRPASWREAIEDMEALIHNRPLKRRPAPTGASTVGPPPDILTTPGQQGPVRASAGRRSRAGTPGRPAAQGGPGQMILWLLLGAWFGIVFNDRIGNPLGLPFSLATARAGVQLPALPSAPAPAPRLAAPQPTPPAAGNPTGVSPGKPPARITPPRDPTASPGASGPLPAELVHELHAALSQGGAVAARLAVAGPVNGIGQDELASLRTALDSLPDPAALVADGLMARRGELITIEYLGRARQVVPLSVLNGELQTEFVSPDGSRRPVAIRIDKLTPAECLRWLPAPTDARDHVAACLLAMAAADRAALQTHGPLTGLLAPVFAYAATRVP